jgi:hypothetical protein
VVAAKYTNDILLLHARHPNPPRKKDQPGNIVFCLQLDLRIVLASEAHGAQAEAAVESQHLSSLSRQAPNL